MFHRLQDCWNRPICSNPGAYIDVMERTTNDGSCTLQTNGNYLRCLNLGSYNYLGFADDWKNTCSKVWSIWYTIITKYGIVMITLLRFSTIHDYHHYIILKLYLYHRLSYHVCSPSWVAYSNGQSVVRHLEAISEP